MKRPIFYKFMERMEWIYDNLFGYSPAGSIEKMHAEINFYTDPLFFAKEGSDLFAASASSPLESCDAVTCGTDTETPHEIYVSFKKAVEKIAQNGVKEEELIRFFCQGEVGRHLQTLTLMTKFF